MYEVGEHNQAVNVLPACWTRAFQARTLTTFQNQLFLIGPSCGTLYSVILHTVTFPDLLTASRARAVVVNLLLSRLLNSSFRLLLLLPPRAVAVAVAAVAAVAVAAAAAAAAPAAAAAAAAFVFRERFLWPLMRTPTPHGSWWRLSEQAG